MPHFCIVVGCGNRSNRDAVSFYAIPAVLHHRHKIRLNELSLRRRNRWIMAIKRSDLTNKELKNEKVCSKHFIMGKPAALEDINHPDWVPSQYMGYSTTPISKTPLSLARKQRYDVRKQTKLQDTLGCSEGETREDPVIEMNEDTAKYVQTDITMDQLFHDRDRLNFATEKLSFLEQQLQKIYFRSICKS